MATREVARSPAVEDYCKAIFTLGEPVGRDRLAERLSLTPGSVSAMLKRLGEVGLIGICFSLMSLVPSTSHDYQLVLQFIPIATTKGMN